MKLRLGIVPKLTLVFFLFAAVLVISLSVLVYDNARSALQTAVTSALLSTALEKETALNAWVEERQQNVAALAATPHLTEKVVGLVSAEPGSVEAGRAHDRLVSDFAPFVQPQGVFLEIMAIDPESGEVLASTNPAEEGKFKESLPYFINGRNGSYVQNVYYSITLQAPAMTASAPIYTEDGHLLAVLAARLNLEEMNAITARHTGLHQSDETFLVNTSNLFVTQPRLIEDSAVLQRGVHTEAVNRCLERSSGVISALDYRNNPALIVYRWLPERELCLIVKIDQAEAFAPANALGGTILLVSGITLLAASALAYWLTRGITRPIRALQADAARIGRGDLETRIPITSHDELGRLAVEFNAMADSLAKKEDLLRDHAAQLEQKVEERTLALREKEHLLSEAQRIAHIGSWQADLAGGEVNWSDEMYRIYDVSPQTYIPSQDSLITLIHPEDKEKMGAWITAAIGGEKREAVEVRVVTRDGSVRTIRGDGEILFDETGRPVRAIGTSEDITERKRAQETLVMSETRYRRLFETAQDGILILDAAGMIMDVNPFLLELLGFRREQFLEKKIWELGLFKDIAANQEAFAELLRKEYIRFENLPLETSAGLRIEVEFVSYVYQMNRQKLIQCNIRNITDRVKAEIEIRRANAKLEERILDRTAELESANKELEAFSYSVSHDLRAPLRAVNGFTRILLDKHAAGLDPEGLRYFNLVRDNARQMGQLVDDLLALSRLGRQMLTKEPVSPVALVSLAREELRAEEAGRQVDFSIGELPECQADPILLKQVFINLLSNALKFTRKRETARIEIGFLPHPRPLSGQESGGALPLPPGEDWGEAVIYFVKDNGAGFDMRYADKLFGVFQRLHRADEFEGTGVGLAIVQRIVHRHGGRVWAEAEVDKGATFYFTI